VGKDKLRRFAAIKDFENVYEPEREHDFELKGKWRESVFQNDNPNHLSNIHTIQHNVT
jgi:hypothetical protein